MARSKGATSSNKKKATARGRANEKSAGKGNTPVPTSVRKISQGRFPGERPLTGEDRPAGGKGDKAEGASAKPRGRAGVRDTTRRGAGRPEPSAGKPVRSGRHIP